MQVRCQRCGWSVNLGREWMAAALAKVNQEKLKYFQVECGKCRHNIKVPTRQIRRFAPRPASEDAAQEGDAQDGS